MMSGLPIYLTILAGLLCATVVYLGVLFLWSPEKGLTFSTHQREHLTSVMADRYFMMAAFMVGSLVYGRPEVIAFAFAATGYVAAHDAAIYAKNGEPYGKHIVPVVLSAIVVGGALIAYFKTGAV